MSGEQAYEPPSPEQFERDLAELSPTKLRQKYRKEAGSHRNAKSRSAAKGVPIHPRWEEFRPFLRDMGPVPSLDHSLDRIDYNNPHYGPGLVRWADKQQQTENRSSTRWVELGGERLTVREFCERTGIPDKTVYSALARGQTGDEIAGHRASQTAWQHPTPRNEQEFWGKYAAWKKRVHRDYRAFAHPEIFYLIRAQRNVAAIYAKLTDHGHDLNPELPVEDDQSLGYWQALYREGSQKLEAARAYVFSRHPQIAGWFRRSGPEWVKRIVELEERVTRPRR